MSRDQRVNDNWALIYAQEEAIKNKSPIFVIFCLVSEFLEATPKIFDFMLQGLKDVEIKLKKLKIPFQIIIGNPPENLFNFIEENNIKKLVIDFSPLKIKKLWNNKLKEMIQIPIYEVDAHNIVPVWHASNKKEYAAYTFRPNIQRLLNEFLDEFPLIKEHPYESSNNILEIDWDSIYHSVKRSSSKTKLDFFKSGEEASKSSFMQFIKNKFDKYELERNDPTKEGTSNLSPYLHFGQISAQRVVLGLMKVKKIISLKGTFYDEIIVRKELSDNFCYYTEDYDNFKGFPDWAKQTLNAHRGDKREYEYTLKEFENAKTHDQLCNAAQIQMITKGKMHGYMRMYWRKKILEWTENPEKALEIAIYLNNKYEIDGRDPNGYVGILWSIGGVHDRAWNERKIYGKIRYMSYKGMKRKFNIENYINEYLNQKLIM